VAISIDSHNRLLAHSSHEAQSVVVVVVLLLMQRRVVVGEEEWVSKSWRNQTLPMIQPVREGAKKGGRGGK